MIDRYGPRWGLFALFVAMLPSHADAQLAPLAGLDRYVEDARASWRIPGLALAVVKGDSVVFAQGFGVLEEGMPERVDEHTIFAIGSSTKAFTAAALGILVDEGLVGWDEPAATYLRGFQLHDPYVTREITVRDLLTHRSGLDRGEFMWYASDADRSEILSRVRHHRPAWSFRYRFGYQNVMYLAAGEIIPAVAGPSWDTFVTERIFEPLGMTRSSTSVLALDGVSNVARPHATLDDDVVPIEYRRIDNIAPAGSINASVRDMAQWVRLNLGRGAFGGSQVLEPETVAELHSPQTLVPAAGGWAMMAPDANFVTYGMGWIVHDYNGHKVVQHGGNIDGMHALVGMIPAEELGVVVLTNLGSNQLTYALMYRIFDAFLGAEPRDWHREYQTRFDSLMAAAREAATQADDARVADVGPSLALDDYAGRYVDPMYGEVTVSVDGGRLVLTRETAFIGDLEHWHFDTFRVTWRDQGLASVIGRPFATFRLNAQGRVVDLDLQGFSVFTRAVGPEPR